MHEQQGAGLQEDWDGGWTHLSEHPVHKLFSRSAAFDRSVFGGLASRTVGTATTEIMVCVSNSSKHTTGFCFLER